MIDYLPDTSGGWVVLGIVIGLVYEAIKSARSKL